MILSEVAGSCEWTIRSNRDISTYRPRKSLVQDGFNETIIQAKSVPSCLTSGKHAARGVATLYLVRVQSCESVPIPRTLVCPRPERDLHRG